MPSSITHSIFANDVLKLVKRKDLVIDENYYNFFAQGPDPLNFYNLIIPFYKNNVRKNYPKMLHSSNTKDKFIFIIKYIINNNLSFNKYFMSYLYGIMCHYFLDSTVHPYIIYFSGNFDLDDKNTYKYNGNHANMEVAIDLILIKDKLNINPYKFKFNKYFSKLDYCDNDLANMMDNCYKEVYDIDNFSNIYFKSISDMYKICKYFRNDRYGIKKMLYSFIDILTTSKFTNMSPLSYHQKLDYSYLSLNHKKWCHITNKSEVYDYSFYDLYDIALKKCVSAIDTVNDVIYNKHSIELLNDVFHNLSYVTGKDCNINKKIKYFYN